MALLSMATIGVHSLISTGNSSVSSIDSSAISEQIYSVPVSLFKLIAQATEVAREMENLRKFDPSPGTDVDLPWAEVKTLEQHICDWKNQYEEYGLDQIASLPREALLYYLAEALWAEKPTLLAGRYSDPPIWSPLV